MTLPLPSPHTAEPMDATPISFPAMTWPDETPAGCPIPRSTDFAGVRFLGRCSDYDVGDTWYPSWADDGHLYSPWTDGQIGGAHCYSETKRTDPAETGQAILKGDDPLDLEIIHLGNEPASSLPYAGRYPAGSLVHNGIWYYGTYCLGPDASQQYEGRSYNWPVLGPVPGFRISRDLGRSWTPSPLSPERPLFPEPADFLGPVKFGAPHFVDFGKNLEHSPDGKAYLVAHGTDGRTPNPRYADNSWISGDQIYLARVTPSEQTINDPSAWEFYSGTNSDQQASWSGRFCDAQPLVTWRQNMGCVTVTYNAPLQRYFMWVTDGWPTNKTMNSYLLESATLTGPWKLVTYLKSFGQQAYFLNFPSKFISPDGRQLWLAYSGNFWKGPEIRENPPGSHYGLVLQHVELLPI